MATAPTIDQLKQEFEERFLDDLDQCSKLGYNPSYLVRMVHEHGAVETARRCIMKPDPKGFDRLWEMKRLDVTVEAFVHDNPKFHPLFEQQTLDACDARLASVGYI